MKRCYTNEMTGVSGGDSCPSSKRQREVLPAEPTHHFKVQPRVGCAPGSDRLLHRAYYLIALVWATLLTATPALAQSGATYKITSSTVDGGGVTFLTSATYKLGGTVGQHDAGDPTGPTYTILGGFWVPSVGGAAPDPLESSANPWSPDPAGVRLNRAGSFKMPGSAEGCD